MTDFSLTTPKLILYLQPQADSVVVLKFFERENIYRLSAKLYRQQLSKGRELICH
jgi:hypothetical protein